MSFTGMPLHTLDNSEWVGHWVTYHGTRRLDDLGNGKVFKVVEKRENNASVGFDAGIYGVQWAAPWALKIAENPTARVSKSKPMSLARAEEILNPYSPAIESLDAEIARLKEKIADLENARKVLAGL